MKFYQSENEYTKIIYFGLNVFGSELKDISPMDQMSILKNRNLTIQSFETLKGWFADIFFEYSWFDISYKIKFLSHTALNGEGLFMKVKNIEDRAYILSDCSRYLDKSSRNVGLSLRMYLNRPISDARTLYEVKEICRNETVPRLNWMEVLNIPRFDLKWWLLKVYPKIKDNYPRGYFLPFLLRSINMTSEVMSNLILEYNEELKSEMFHLFFQNELKRDFNYSVVIITDFFRKVSMLKRLASLKGLRHHLPDELVLKILK